MMSMRSALLTLGAQYEILGRVANLGSEARSHLNEELAAWESILEERNRSFEELQNITLPTDFSLHELSRSSNLEVAELATKVLRLAAAVLKQNAELTGVVSVRKDSVAAKLGEARQHLRIHRAYYAESPLRKGTLSDKRL